MGNKVTPEKKMTLINSTANDNQTHVSWYMLMDHSGIGVVYMQRPKQIGQLQS